MKIILLFISVYSIQVLGYAQKYDYQWLHGNNPKGTDSVYNFIVDFNGTGTWPDIKRLTTQYLPVTTSVSMADQTGKLIFYTNGCSVFNSDHSMMNNGNNLLGNNGNCMATNQVDVQVLQGIFSLALEGNDYLLIGLDAFQVGSSNVCFVSKLTAHRLNIAENAATVLEKNVLLKEGCFQAARATQSRRIGLGLRCLRRPRPHGLPDHAGSSGRSAYEHPIHQSRSGHSGRCGCTRRSARPVCLRGL
jgi:hypothetical protein